MNHQISLPLDQAIVKMRLFVNNHVSCFYAKNLPQSHTGRVVNYMSKIGNKIVEDVSHILKIV